MTTITAAISADAATSDAECRRDLAGHLADFRAALLDEAALIAAADRSRFDSEVATLTAARDIVIGQRETAQRERDEARGLLGALTADLNATREKLTTAEAFRDSLQAEVDGLRVELTSMTIMRDKAHAAHEQAVADWSARGDRLIGLCHALGCPNDQQSCLDAIKALRAEVDKLRARPELTVDMAERVISTYCDEFAATDREGRTDVWAEVDQARRDHAIGVMKSTIDKLGAVTLPAQDAAAALWKAIDDQIVVEAEKVRDGSGVDWHSAYSGAIGTRAKAEAIVRAALASLGAPATTPPATVATLTEDRLADVLASLSTWRGERMPWHSDSTRPWASDLMGRLGVITTPSKPADVFAGVSIEELDKVQMTAEVEYAIKVGSHSDSTPACRAAGLSAVLDALRVKLVAPVDPDAVLADVFGAPHWRSFANEYRTARCVAMRATLEAKGIPVTPEAGK